MPKTYTGAGIGIRHMNNILKQLNECPLTITDLMMAGPICFDSIHRYLRKLLEMGKITVEKRGRTKFYSAVPGTELIPEVFTEHIDRHLNRSNKPIGRPRKTPVPQLGAPEWKPSRKVVAAQQIGVRRDPLVAALFGGAAC